MRRAGNDEEVMLTALWQFEKSGIHDLLARLLNIDGIVKAQVIPSAREETVVVGSGEERVVAGGGWAEEAISFQREGDDHKDNDGGYHGVEHDAPRVRMGDSDLRHAHAQVAQTVGETHIGDAHLGHDGYRFRREERESGRGRGRGDALT